MAQLQYPWDDHPAAGTTREIVPGVRWLTMPMGGSLTHINLYLIEDRDGWFVVDTGLNNDETRDFWMQIVDGLDKPVTGVVCTHMHPDHIGCSAMLTDHFRAPLYMSRGEYYQARSFSATGPGHHTSWQGEVFYRAAGMPADYLEQLQQMWTARAASNDGFSMPAVPMGYERLQDGDVLTIGEHDWQVVVGSGHSPEHVCLLSKALRVMFSGDQILPVITSNVSVHPTEPHANPLKDWMESHDKLLGRIPGDTLVLPAHNLPFRGVRQRLSELIDHHEDRMLAIEEACQERALTARDMLPVLFKRELDPRQMMMALGEAIAHIHLLEHRNRLERVPGEDGAHYFRSIDPSLRRRMHPGTHDAPGDGPMMV